jgi:hypothetical protein
MVYATLEVVYRKIEIKFNPRLSVHTRKPNIRMMPMTLEIGASGSRDS